MYDKNLVDGMGFWSQLFHLEEDINGAAFLYLNSEDLRELGFKRGASMNIIKIIDELLHASWNIDIRS